MHSRCTGMVCCDSPVYRDTARWESVPEGQVPAGTAQIPCQGAEPDTSDRPALPHSASTGQLAGPKSTTIYGHERNRTQIPLQHRHHSNRPYKGFPVSILLSRQSPTPADLPRFFLSSAPVPSDEYPKDPAEMSRAHFDEPDKTRYHRTSDQREPPKALQTAASEAYTF